jgi:hypothetical protein
MGACAIGLLVGRFEDKGYATSLRYVDKTLGNRQNHFPALDDTGTRNQDQRTITPDTYVTYLDHPEMLLKNDTMPLAD